MNSARSLAAEWERIDLLGSTVVANRNGDSIPEQVEKRLTELQQEIHKLRANPPWLSMVNECNLNTLDQDILACSLAPQAEPRLGWMFQKLQPGLTTTYPSPALIREIFYLNSDESVDFNDRLNSDSPLLSNNLIERSSNDIFQPIRPTSRASNGLLGWSHQDNLNIPGAIKIQATGTWDKLVLPDNCIQSLREFLYWVIYREKVTHEWQGRITGGPVALFSGPSGTGKTYAAEVVANNFGFPLFRVDLGLLVSKYIGETEKNLNALFESSHGRNVMLLFDEADSLFGQRGEVKEARDRYANLEISHLLSRIEAHHGPCILTTNLRQNVDSAFGRRFQLVVEFPRPDSKARAKLWKLYIPPGAPRDMNIDFKMLGMEVSLTGGQIRNAALHAAFLSAGESSIITLSHIARAVWNELHKDGGEITTSSLGKLKNYLPKEILNASH